MSTGPLLLLLASAALLVLEVVIPSFGMLGLLSATAFVFACVLGFQESTTAGFIVVLSGLIIFPVALGVGFKLVRKSPFAHRTMLFAPRRDEIQRGTGGDLSALTGRFGVALTDLRPAGRAEIAGLRTDVVSATTFIQKHTPIRVVFVEGSRVVVEPRETTPS
jgi:membrane-bound ClpP family serine protease